MKKPRETAMLDGERYDHTPPINPEDVPVMDTGDLAPLFDNEEK